MKYVSALMFVVLATCQVALATNCNSLMKMPLQSGKITSAVIQPSGSFVAPNSQRFSDLPSFCRVSATLTPSSDSLIKIEVWLPVKDWNRKFEGTGNGGYAGAISYPSLAAGLRQGFAVANTDMGTSRPKMESADALIGHPERWTDWGWRATHDMTIAAKEIVHTYYSEEPQYSYFVGCSNGGGQGLMEAQRFPDDYDGIVAGAPGYNHTRLHMEILWSFMATELNPESHLPGSKLTLISQAVLRACSKEKAVPSDGFLSNPMACQWNPQVLQCKSTDGPTCLTSQQVEAVRKILRGPTNPVTGASIYPGLLPGSEAGWKWKGWANREGEHTPFDSNFKWVFGPSWNWRTFDFNRDVRSVDDALAANLNYTNPDLETFKAKGHKLIGYHGWADPLIPPLGSIEYYRSVEKAQRVDAASHHRTELNETQSFYRLFMVPGMYHCGGGPGFNSLNATVDVLPTLEKWVENDVAPKQIVAKRVVDGTTVMTRPICPFPQIARYNGSGDPKDATSFSCDSRAHSVLDGEKR
jgi:Tannase and feruloyl esterase